MRLKIRRVAGSPDFGGTRPVWVIANDDREYLLKFRYDGMERDISVFNESLAYRLSEELDVGYRLAELVFISIDREDMGLFEEAFRCRQIDEEALRNAKGSIGVNIGISKILGAEKATEGFTKRFAATLANMDNYLLNKDRYSENPNILYSKQDKRYYAIDFGQALLEHRVYEAMREGYYDKYLMSLQNCDIFKEKRYLLRESDHKKAKDGFNLLCNKIEGIIKGLPQEWEPVKFRKEIAELIAFRATNSYKSAYECPFELFK